MNITKLLSVMFFCSFLIISGCVPETGKKPKNERVSVTLEEAKEKSEAELKRRGYPVEDMLVKADEKNTAWGKFVAKDPSILQREIVKRMNLEGKNYWVIYYAPQRAGKGGDAWIFVDTHDGTILGVILGE